MYIGYILSSSMTLALSELITSPATARVSFICAGTRFEVDRITGWARIIPGTIDAHRAVTDMDAQEATRSNHARGSTKSYLTTYAPRRPIPELSTSYRDRFSAFHNHHFPCAKCECWFRPSPEQVLVKDQRGIGGPLTSHTTYSSRQASSTSVEADSPSAVYLHYLRGC